MTTDIRIRSRRRDGGIDVTVLLRHPMESGLRKDAAGRPLPAHFITDATVSVDDRVVLEATLGIAVSRDPLLTFRLEQDLPADARIAVRWRDNLGAEQQAETRIG
jgi:sulfur-oxidizing protein SoxZ